MTCVVVITTGGTIAMRTDPELGGALPAVSGQELVAALPALTEICPVEAQEFCNIPSFHMTPRHMLRLAHAVEAALARPDVAGVVVTHGTDTLEETAYFLDLYLAPDKPVCLTGAMRNAGDISADGPFNLCCAVRAAASPRLRGYGVLVACNGELHAARTVTKMHKSAVQAFASPGWGPVGIVDDGAIILGCPPVRREPLRPPAPAWNVPLIKMYTGMDARIFDALLGTGLEGLVIEAYGRGNVAADIVPDIVRLLRQGVPVVIASRVPAGRTLGVYAVEGGAHNLQGLGVLLSGELSSHKARIRLMLALGLTRNPAALSVYFNDQ